MNVYCRPPDYFTVFGKRLQATIVNYFRNKGLSSRFLCLMVEKPLWVFVKMSLGNIQKAFLYLRSLKAGVLQNRQDVAWEEVCHPH